MEEQANSRTRMCREDRCGREGSCAPQSAQSTDSNTSSAGCIGQRVTPRGTTEWVKDERRAAANQRPSLAPGKSAPGSQSGRTPEQERISLRALASQLGTSHQLLSFHLRRLDKWLARVYEIKANEIRDRAKAENRFLAPWEEAQTRTLERAALCSVLYRALEETFKRWEVEFGEANKLTKKQLKMLNLLERRGVPFAQKMLQDRENNLSASVHPETQSVRRSRAETKHTSSSSRQLMLRPIAPCGSPADSRTDTSR